MAHAAVEGPGNLDNGGRTMAIEVVSLPQWHCGECRERRSHLRITHLVHNTTTQNNQISLYCTYPEDTTTPRQSVTAVLHICADAVHLLFGESAEKKKRASAGYPQTRLVTLVFSHVLTYTTY